MSKTKEQELWFRKQELLELLEDEIKKGKNFLVDNEDLDSYNRIKELWQVDAELLGFEQGKQSQNFLWIKEIKEAQEKLEKGIFREIVNIDEYLFGMFNEYDKDCRERKGVQKLRDRIIYHIRILRKKLKDVRIPIDKIIGQELLGVKHEE